MDNPTIIAFDIATNTGFSVYRNGQATCGTFTAKRKKGRKTVADDHPGTEYLQFGKWSSQLIQNVQPDLIVYEEALGHWKNILAALKPYGFRGLMLTYAALHEVPVLPVTNTTLKKHATGKGNAKKPEMIAAAKRRWPYLTVDNDNEGDALCLLDYALATQYGIERLTLS